MIDVNIEYGKDGQCPRCKSMYSVMEKHRRVPVNPDMPKGAMSDVCIKSERCVCGTHYSYPDGKHIFRPRNAPCSWCGEATITIDKEGAWRARYCGCGMNVYCSDGTKVFFARENMIHIPASVNRLDEKIKEKIQEKRA